MTEITILKQFCAELKLDPREVRERLRDAVRDQKKYPELARRISLAHLGNGSRDQQVRRKRGGCLPGSNLCEHVGVMVLLPHPAEPHFC